MAKVELCAPVLIGKRKGQNFWVLALPRTAEIANYSRLRGSK
jgi:hypothetical protein